MTIISAACETSNISPFEFAFPFFTMPKASAMKAMKKAKAGTAMKKAKAGAAPAPKAMKKAKKAAAPAPKAMKAMKQDCFFIC